MAYNIRIKTACFLAFLLSMASCTKDIDFTQGEDLEVYPVMETSLVYFKGSVPDLLENGISDTGLLVDEVVLEAFNNEFFVENVTRADVVLELTNSINRNFSILVQCLNDTDQIQHQFSFSVAASPDNLPITTTHTEIFEGATLNALKRTTKLVLTLQMEAGDPLNQSSLGSIALRSKGIFYLTIEG
ncbi:MAG: hypothetical protein ACK5NB_05415 [Flavobacteriaceae bacterium]